MSNFKVSRIGQGGYMRFDHKNDLSSEMIEIKNTLRQFILKAEYNDALEYLNKKKKVYPRSYFIESYLSTLKSEVAFSMDEKNMKSIFKKTALRLKQLLKYSRSADRSIRCRNLNEYYWFSMQYLKQYNFGQRIIKRGGSAGHYSSAVGATNYSYQLILANKVEMSKHWAQIAVQEWEIYFQRVSKDYYDPWYWYSLALAILNKKAESIKAMKRSARISGKNLKKDRAFKKLQNMIKNIRHRTKQSKIT